MLSNSIKRTMAMRLQPCLALLVLLIASMTLSLSAQPSSVYMEVANAFNATGGLIEGGEEEMAMDSEASRRVLAQSRYISYGVLNKDSIPCNRRGSSYYNCRGHKKVRPYSRGCNKITRCGGRYH